MMYRYIGDREEPKQWIPGIPARDVKSSELTKEQLALVEASPLYEAEQPVSAKASKPKEKTDAT